jgi:drug/metabolite transporter (DMT)-like permease
VSAHHLGEIFSVLAALTWAVSVVLFRMVGKRYRPLELNFFKNMIAAVLFLVTLILTRQSFHYEAPLHDYLILLLSGVLGIALGDTLFFKSLNIVGAGLSQIVSLAYSPFVILFTFVFLGERLTAWDLLGAVLILCGILLTSSNTPGHGLTKHEYRVGIGLATLSVAMNALGITIAKPVLNHSPVLWAATVRLLGGIVSLATLTAFSPRHRRLWKTLRPSRSWTVAVPAATLGAYVAMMVWIAGMKFTQASTAAILNQTSAVFVLPIAALVLHEPITARKVTAVATALAGVALVTLV